MYLTPTEQHWACDIEADNLIDSVTKIHCACVENVKTGETRSFNNGKDFRDWVSSVNPILVGHNFLAYDAPVLNRLWGTRISVSHIVDTFVMSQLYNPSMGKPLGCKKGPHSLEAWGIRLRLRKGDYNDFTTFTPEMLAYCKQDVSITAQLFSKMSQRMTMVGFKERGVELEHKAWHIIQNKQKRDGFPFNYKEAVALYAKLRNIEEALKSDIYKLWPPRLEKVASYKKATRKDGSFNKQYQGHLGQYPKSS